MTAWLSKTSIVYTFDYGHLMVYKALSKIKEVSKFHIDIKQSLL